MATTLPSSAVPISTSLHWGRIVGGAFLLEALLFVTLIPIGLVYGMPGGPLPTTDFTVFFTAVPIGCFVGGVLISRWMVGKLASRRVLHGLLLGLVATAIYFGICSTQPGGVASVIAGYGAPLFWATQALRVAGCVVGAASGRGPVVRV